MTDDERAAVQRRIAEHIRQWLAELPLERGSQFAELMAACTSNPIAPWGLVLAVVVRDDRLWDALAQVRQHIILMDALASN